MARSSVHGTQSKAAPRRDRNGFVNRRSTVQSCPPAPSSENPVFTQESARKALADYQSGRASARKASQAIAWLIRNLSGQFGGDELASIVRAAADCADARLLPVGGA